MPRLFIHARNSQFHSRDDGADYDQPEDALKAGVQSAIVIAADEVGGGERSAAVEVSIVRDDGAEVLKSVVTVSVSTLLAGDGALTPAARAAGVDTPQMDNNSL